MRKQKIFSSNKHIFDPFMRLFKTSAGRARLALKKNEKEKKRFPQTEKFAKEMKIEELSLSAIKPYAKNPRKNDGAVNGVAESPVVLRDIEFFSTCEHHLLPFFGTVTVGYIPGNEVVGISKLARLVECFSRRLQIQERMCEQIADAIQSELNPRGIYVRAKAKHLCMVARGIQKQNAVMDSIAVRGEYSSIEKLI